MPCRTQVMRSLRHHSIMFRRERSRWSGPPWYEHFCRGMLKGPRGMPCLLSFKMHTWWTQPHGRRVWCSSEHPEWPRRHPVFRQIKSRTLGPAKSKWVYRNNGMPSVGFKNYQSLVSGCWRGQAWLVLSSCFFMVSVAVCSGNFGLF